MLIREFRDGMEEFTKTISTTVNTVLLSIVYIFGVGVAHLVIKRNKMRILDLKKKNESYWSDFHPSSRHYRQF